MAALGTVATAAGKRQLERVVKEAVDSGADMIEFERVPDGLEISYFVGHTGIGSLLDDRELEAALFRLVDERTRNRRTFQVDIWNSKRGREALCEAPFGPFRQRLPTPFWPPLFGFDCASSNARQVRVPGGKDHDHVDDSEEVQAMIVLGDGSAVQNYLFDMAIARASSRAAPASR